MVGPPHLPRDLLDEVEAALRETAAELAGRHRRLAALEELAALCRQLREELGRGVDVFDLVRGATSDPERRRRHDLVSVLRTRT
jgi:hypothetical protein